MLTVGAGLSDHIPRFLALFGRLGVVSLDDLQYVKESVSYTRLLFNWPSHLEQDLTNDKIPIVAIRKFLGARDQFKRKA